MAENPATLAAIESRWRPLSDSEKVTAEALSADVWARAQALVPTLNAALDSEAVSTELATAILTAAVIRVLRNPEGFRQQQIDDFSYTRDTSLSSGELYLSEDELRLLGKPARRAVSMQVRSRFGGTTWA